MMFSNIKYQENTQQKYRRYHCDASKDEHYAGTHIAGGNIVTYKRIFYLMTHNTSQLHIIEFYDVAVLLLLNVSFFQPSTERFAMVNKCCTAKDSRADFFKGLLTLQSNQEVSSQHYSQIINFKPEQIIS